MKDASIVHIVENSEYDSEIIYENLDDSLFDVIEPEDSVVLKPNWVKESHLYKDNEWDYVITHPAVITAVLKKVLDILKKGAKIIITDGPQTDSSFDKIIEKYPVDLWYEMTKEKGVDLQIIDLRDDEWIMKGGVVIDRKNLPGDPKGKVEVNLLNSLSEFHSHKKSTLGYYGADYNIEETNKAHDGRNNVYSVSRSVIEADVFINLPKLKTHKKAGITCCLKNLVGINTYKNFLPHHSQGYPSQNGDQYKDKKLSTKVEGPLISFIKNNILIFTYGAKLLKPFVKIGYKIFGKTDQTIRSGNWYGNDTLWRMVIDLNKILFYADSKGTMKEGSWSNRKKYIGIVDAIYAGEGNGPMSPDKVIMNKLILGRNPVAIDTVCAELMNFSYKNIPSINRSYNLSNYPLCNFNAEDIRVIYSQNEYSIKNIPHSIRLNFKPHFGWIGHIEYE